MRDLTKNNARLAGLCQALLLAGLLIAGTSLAQAGSKTEELAVSSAGTAGSQGTVLLFEDFSGTTFPPDGWSTVPLDGQGEIWNRRTSHFNSPPASAWKGRNPIDDGFQNDWLITPSIQLGEGSVLTFADRGLEDISGASYTGLFVNVSTDSCHPADGDFVEVAEIDDSIPATWREDVTVELSDFNDQEICIGFQFTGTNAHSWSIDDVQVTSLEDRILYSRFEQQPGDTFKDCPDCPTIVVIPAGTFTQGSPESEPDSDDNERPQREVNVPTFALGQTEVTFEQWDACVADGGCSHTPDDEGWGRGNRPVINVSWTDAQEYVDWLSNKTGHNYRLPSESEREYATRSGTTGRFNTGDCITTDQANFRGTQPAEGCPSGNYREQTLPVNSFTPNAFGLYDTHGNVIEWVQDCWNLSYNDAPTDGSAWMSGDCSRAALRGGSWGNYGNWLRSAYRYGVTRGVRSSNFGFRVARSVDL